MKERCSMVTVIKLFERLTLPLGHVSSKVISCTQVCPPFHIHCEKNGLKHSFPPFNTLVQKWYKIYKYMCKMVGFLRCLKMVGILRCLKMVGFQRCLKKVGFLRCLKMVGFLHENTGLTFLRHGFCDIFYIFFITRFLLKIQP